MDAPKNTPKVLTPRGLWHFAYFVFRRRRGFSDPSWAGQASAVIGLAVPTMFIYIIVGVLLIRLLGIQPPRPPTSASSFFAAYLSLFGLAILPNALMAMRKTEYQEYRRQFDLWPPGKMQEAKFFFWVAFLAVTTGGAYLLAATLRAGARA